MSIKKFKFVSPGIKTKEVDLSGIPANATGIGPVVIGRARKGPGMVPVKVNSFNEFTQVFGDPIRGTGTGDIWREGNTTSPTYAAYAAEAYLRNSGPLTFVRLLGSESDDPNASGYDRAGWTTTATSANAAVASNGGAYGLFIIPSSSAGYSANITGSLAAIWYLNAGAIRLVGDDPIGRDVGTNGTAVLVKSVGSSYEFQAIIENASGTVVKNTTFNFNENSSKNIRKVFNTNPTLANSDVTPSDSLVTYWLGETFETHLRSTVSETSGSVAGNVLGMIVALENATINHADYQGIEATPAETGWVIAQDLGTNTGSYDATSMTKLFKFAVNRGEGSGEWEQNNLKISILDLKPSNNLYYKYGTFTVAVRDANDTDKNPNFLEVFTGCNLDPNSINYIANRIGDKKVTWDKTEKRHRELGDYENKSNYIRVEMNSAIEQGGVDPELLPFGFYGPARFKPITLVSGSTVAATALMKGSGSVPHAPLAGGGTVAIPGITNFTASLLFPKMDVLVSSSAAGTLRDGDAYFGIYTNRTGTKRFNEDYTDLTRIMPDGIDSHTANLTTTEYSFIFSLDDVVAVSGSSTLSYWLSGSRASGLSVTAQATGLTGSTDGYKSILNRGNDKFTMPLHGGFDGLDITERDPFRNAYLANDGTPNGNYAVYSLRRAIDSVSDPEVTEMNLITIPGITHQGTTNHLLDTVEDRADSLAIIDLEGGYVPSHENTSAESARLGSVSTTITNLKNRSLNSSYGCAYYPWVKIRDSRSGFPLWMPPSVVALGTMAKSAKDTAVWFAPAGFNRGGLNKGSSGLDVIDVREKLTQQNRDDLYEININPIASFPSEGIVIFGQKTLQANPSALDRINVRRLMIFVKKGLSQIAARTLFDQNVKVTWARFKNEADAFLEGVKTGFGLTDFRVVLDETTTTPELIDRNTLYAKVFLKTARSIEFIGLDFYITRTGASFDDL